MIRNRLRSLGLLRRELIFIQSSTETNFSQTSIHGASERQPVRNLIWKTAICFLPRMLKKKRTRQNRLKHLKSFENIKLISRLFRSQRLKSWPKLSQLVMLISCYKVWAKVSFEARKVLLTNQWTQF